MARTLTPKDAHAIMNLLVKQATGQQNITVVDTSSFVSAGEEVLATGMENVFNSLNIVLAKTIVAVRKYDAKLTLMDAIDSGVYSNRLRKISYYSSEALADGDHNTDLFTNLANGFTSGENLDADGAARSTKSQFEQVQKEVLERNFGGTSVWQHGITIYEDQLQIAFVDDASFAAFVGGYLTEHENDIESTREAWNRMSLINKIAAVYDMTSVMPGSVIDLTAGFNAKFGTSYTGEQLRSTYLKEFLAYFVSEFKKVSKHMTERSKNFHWAPASKGGNTNLLRHTPYADQRVYLYSDLFVEAEAMVLPEIFNPQFLDIKTQYQEIGFWQSEDDRPAIKCEPAVPDFAGAGTGQTKGTQVNLPYVVGCILDRDALMTDFQLESARTSPLEARKGYRTTWLSIARNIISDETENSVIFIMS